MADDPLICDTLVSMHSQLLLEFLFEQIQKLTILWKKYETPLSPPKKKPYFEECQKSHAQIFWIYIHAIVFLTSINGLNTTKTLPPNSNGITQCGKFLTTQNFLCEIIYWVESFWDSWSKISSSSKLYRDPEKSIWV